MMENKKQKKNTPPKKPNKQDVRNDESTFVVESLITVTRRAGTPATMGFDARRRVQRGIFHLTHKEGEIKSGLRIILNNLNKSHR